MWSFGPPGQLCSADLGVTLAGACRLTCVVVGDDFAPRVTSQARRKLAAECVVGLARLK